MAELTDLKIKRMKLGRAKKTGKLKQSDLISDGKVRGLCLQLTRGKDRTHKSWIFRYARDGKETKMGLGPYPVVSLALAREMALGLALKLVQKIDPLNERRVEQAKQKAAEAKTITFEEATKRYIEAHSDEWKSLKFIKAWQAGMKAYAYPVLGGLNVRDIDRGLVLRVLEPVWATKVPTAKVLRQRIEAILDWCHARGYRDGDNPAVWSGFLEHILPDPAKVRRLKITHHAALAYQRVPAFMAALAEKRLIQAQCLRFSILTAARPGEACGARWDEVNRDERLWVIPQSRMKGNREHRVTLSDAAIEVLRERQAVRDGEFVFRGLKGKSIVTNSMLKLITAMNAEAKANGIPQWLDGDRQITAHGTSRSSFRTWTAEKTNVPAEAAEICLAHQYGDETWIAYQRGPLLEKRRELMQAWGNYATGRSGAGVIQLEDRKRASRRKRA